MSTYVPDRWVMVEITSKKYGMLRKVLAGWYGGYAGGDSWKLSSGTLQVIDLGDRFEFPQHSGSTYICGKGSYGLTSYTQQVYAGFEEKMSDNDLGATIRILSEDEIRESPWSSK